MLNPGVRLGFKIVAGFGETAAFVALAWIGYALDLKDQNSVFGTAIARTKENAAWMVVASGVAIGATRLTRRVVADRPESEETVRRCVGEALDTFRKKCFPGLSDKTPKDENRVTIFKRVQWRFWIRPFRCPVWPWGWNRFPGSGWLVLAHRSGHATQSSKTVFLVPDDASKAEGVAGQAWRGDGAVRVRQLPDLNEIEYVGNVRAIWYALCRSFNLRCAGEEIYRKNRENVRHYAKATYTSARVVWQRVRSGKRTPISILAIPLEGRDNQRWGVLVLDSSNAVESLDSEDKKFRFALARLKSELDRLGVTRV